MNIRRNPETGRQAVLWLATALVVLLGAAGCAFVIVVGADHPERHFWIWGGIFGGLMLLLITMARTRQQTPGRWLLHWLVREKAHPRNVLRIGRKKPPADFGKNGPPTLESVREASEQNIKWVPHGAPPNRSRPK